MNSGTNWDEKAWKRMHVMNCSVPAECRREDCCLLVVNWYLCSGTRIQWFESIPEGMKPSVTVFSLAIEKWKWLFPVWLLWHLGKWSVQALPIFLFDDQILHLLSQAHISESQNDKLKDRQEKENIYDRSISNEYIWTYMLLPHVHKEASYYWMQEQISIWLKQNLHVTGQWR